LPLPNQNEGYRIKIRQIVWASIKAEDCSVLTGKRVEIGSGKTEATN